jgi:hypothetical protein
MNCNQPCNHDLAQEVGYFSSPSPTTPTYDPTKHDGPCAICRRPLTPNDVRTHSLMAKDGSNSYFYRTHRTCHEALTPQQSTELDFHMVPQIEAN